MPRKNVLERYQLVTDGAMASTITSPVVTIKFLDNILVEFVSTGAPDGTYEIQLSADYLQDPYGNVLNAGNWTPLTLNPVPTIAAAGVVVIDCNQMSAPYLRAVWTPTSGSGVLNVFVSAKEI